MKRFDSGEPIPGLFAAAEVAGGVHGANCLGGSSLLGCVSGDSATAYLLQMTSAIVQKAGGRLGVFVRQLESKPASSPAPSQPAATSDPASSSAAKEFTAADVAKHNKVDIWVIVNGQVLDVTSVSACLPVVWLVC